MKSLIALALAAMSGVAAAQSVEMSLLSPKGDDQKIGQIKYEQTDYGVLFTPDLHGLSPGVHGFHLHAKPSCTMTKVDGKDVVGGGAGGHWDPDNTGAHKGPYDKTGHKGDLPAVYVAADGKATYPVLAPRLKVADLAGHALMIHVGGDNYSDHPAALGGGGGRMACGVVK